MRYSGLFLAALSLTWLGCAHSRTEIQASDDLSLAQYRGIGVAPFEDSRGHGDAIASEIETGLENLMYDSVDPAVLKQILMQYKIDRREGLSLEALEMIREKTSADAIIMGRVAPDWSVASFVMIDTGMGDEVLRAVIRPSGRKQKAFTDSHEIAQAVLKVLKSLR